MRGSGARATSLALAAGALAAGCETAMTGDSDVEALREAGRVRVPLAEARGVDADPVLGFGLGGLVVSVYPALIARSVELENSAVLRVDHGSVEVLPGEASVEKAGWSAARVRIPLRLAMAVDVRGGGGGGADPGGAPLEGVRCVFSFRVMVLMVKGYVYGHEYGGRARLGDCVYTDGLPVFDGEDGGVLARFLDARVGRALVDVEADEEASGWDSRRDDGLTPWFFDGFGSRAN